MRNLGLPLLVTVVTLASLVFFVAPRVAHAGVTIDSAPCRFSGRTSTTFGLYADALSTTMLASTGGVYDVTLDGLSADLLGTHVQVHATAVVKNHPALTFEAFTSLASFELRTAHDVAVVPDHVWIRRDETIVALGGALGRMQIEIPDRGWPTVAADVPCSDVTMQRAARDPIEEAAFTARLAKLGTASRVLLIEDDVTFRASPGGAVVYRFTLESGSVRPSLDAYESKGTFTHVVYGGTPFVDAWVETTALELEPPSGWTCGGCGKLGRGHRTAVHQKHIPLLVTEDTELRLAPHGEHVLATLPIGTALIGREDVDGWMRVELKDRELVAADGEAFWVPATSVTRTKWRRH